jgi:putative ABC transport system permease protein
MSLTQLLRKRVGLVQALIVRQPVRSLTGICGIAVACLLMFVQLGFRDGLFNQSVRVHEALRADLVVINRDSTSLATMRPFARQRLGQIYGDHDVNDISLVRVRPLRWRNELTSRSRNILALGVDPNDPPLSLTSTTTQLNSIRGLFNVLFDSNSRREFGPIAKLVNQGKSVTSEVNGYRLSVTGLVSIGPSFAYDGYLVASRATVEALINDGSQGDAEIGLITLKPNADVDNVLSRLLKYMPDDINILTKQGYVDFERNYWRKGSSIGFVFNFGAILGLFVGAVMIYQVLYTDVSDHLSEYATLRAMGYSMSYLYSIVIRQGIVLALLGFFPSLLLGEVAYIAIRKGTNIAVTMSLSIATSVFLLSFVTSFLSALLVTRRLWSADPADIF